MKFLNFGSANIDYVYALDHIVLPGETISSRSLNIFPGGKGLNQSIALARAGVDIHHAGCIGLDGELLMNTLESGGVNTKYIKRTQEKSGHAIILVGNDAENSIILYAGANHKIEKEHIDNVLSDFSAGDVILLQNEINNLEYIIESAHKKGMFIVFNCAPINQNIFELDMSLISCIILNEVEMSEITGNDDIESGFEWLLNKNPDMKIMLTLGKNGCIYVDKNQRVSHPIFKVKAVDTTAAGDTFTGYFISEMSKEREMKDILRVASCASAIAVTRDGASTSIPTYDEVVKALKTMEIAE